MKNSLLLFCFFVLISCQTTPEKLLVQEEEIPSTEKRLIHPTLEEGRYNVAFLIMDGVYNTELTAPFDIFQHTIFRDSIKAMNVFLVANESDYVRTFEGIYIVPNFNYLEDSLPPIDILVVPSAEHHLDSDLEDEKMLNFIRKTSKNALYVMSHCDGAFVLAKSGILEGKESTTFPADVEAYRKMFPELTIHEDVLFVHDDKYITSAGGAKSFEASLYLCEVLYGKKVADQLANGLVIDWDLESLKYLKVD
ncbi:MAG: DJ-1/PfpI family protein [Aureispira sp.]|nr:DJ-1/PfpI family protein [Aureispira sp.]